MNVIDKHNTKNLKDIRALAYLGDKNMHNWKAYVISHNKYHDVQTALVDQNYNDFTDRKNVTFLLDKIKCDTLDFVISIVSGRAASADFEAA